MKNNSEEIKKKTTTYPYKILPFNKMTVKTFNGLKKEHVLEFFRIEALLRSEPLQMIYQFKEERSETVSRNTLLRNYGITWSILEGEHHKLLDPENNNKPSSTDPVFDMKKHVHSSDEKKGAIREAEDWKNTLLENPLEGQHMFFQLDVAFPPETIIKALRPLLKKAHDNFNKMPQLFTEDKFDRAAAQGRVLIEIVQPNKNFPFILGRLPSYYPPARKLMKLDPIKWLNYFKCYDLRHIDDLTYGEIAQKMYHDNKKRDRAEKAVNRVSQMIEKAALRQWPPLHID